MNCSVLEVLDEFRRILFIHHRMVINGSDNDEDGYKDNIVS
jgi:hypothetical protein